MNTARIAGRAHSPFGKPDLAGMFNMGGAAVATCVSIPERAT